MKKLITLLLACASVCFVKAQNDKNCTIDEYVLLKEKPPQITDREALEMIRNPNDSMYVDQTEGVRLMNNLFIPHIRTERYSKTIRLRNASMLPKWEISDYTLRSVGPSRTDWGQLITWILAFLFLIFIGIINFSNPNLWDKPKSLKDWLTATGVIWSVVVGLLAGVLYTLITYHHHDNNFPIKLPAPPVFIPMIASYIGCSLLGLFVHLYRNGFGVKKDLAIT